MALPAVTGTVMRTGLLGQACACVCASTMPGAASRSDKAARKARRMGRLNWGLFRLATPDLGQAQCVFAAPRASLSGPALSPITPEHGCPTAKAGYGFPLPRVAA